MRKEREKNTAAQLQQVLARKKRLEAEVKREHEAAELLRRDRERLRLAERAGQVGVFDWDLRTGEIFTTGELEKLFGLTPGELHGRYEGWTRLVHPEDLPRIEQDFVKWLQSGRPEHRWEYRLVRPDGETRFLEARAELVRDASGEPRRIVGTNVDITERRQMEQALQESEERYRSLLELAPDAVLVYQDERIVFANAAVLKLVGARSVEELLGRRGMDLLHPKEHAEVQERVRRVLESGGTLERKERCLVRLDGQEFDGETAIGRVTWMGQPAVQVIARDITERKRTEAKIRESEELFRSYAESSQDVFWIIDAERQELEYLNPAFEQVWGCSREGFTLQAGQQSVHPEDLPRVLQALHDSEKGPRFDIEYRIVRPDGSIRWISDYGFTIRDEKGEVRRVAGIARDITERKQAEEALQKSEQRLRTLVAATFEGIAISENYRLVEVNEQLARLLGYRPEELIGQEVAAMAAPADRERVLENIRTGRESHIEHEVVRKDGTRLVVETHGQTVQTGERRVRFTAIRNITERKRTEEVLRQQNERLHLLSEAAGRLLSTQAPEATVRELFERLAPQIGLDVYFNFLVEDSGQVLRLDSWAGIPEEVAQRLARLEPGQTLSGQVAQERRTLVLNDVQHSTAPEAALVRALGLRAYAAFPLLVGERLLGTLSFGTQQRDALSPDEVEFLRTVSYYVAVAQEQAWRRRELERTVAERTARLREMVAELERMSYSMIHDMRAPLRAMHGYAHLLSRETAGRLSAQEREFAERIMNSANRLDQLVTDALSYNKAVRQELKLGTVNAGALLRGILSSYPEFRAGRAEIRLEGDFPLVQGNEAALTQCFSHLLQNAIKFVAPGRPPRVRVWAQGRECGTESAEECAAGNEPPAARTATASPASAAGGWVRIWFEDNGVGIAPEHQQKIFQMFQQLDAGRGGTGIGLALVHKLAERMGGQVGVESELGKGSRFWIELRRA